MPIALLGFIILPDLPHNCRAFYLTPKERAFGQKRMKLEGRKGKGPFTRAKFKKIFSSWHLYLVRQLLIAYCKSGEQVLKPSRSLPPASFILARSRMCHVQQRECFPRPSVRSMVAVSQRPDLQNMANQRLSNSYERCSGSHNSSLRLVI